MSAFIVGTDHIDYLVTATVVWHGLHSVDRLHLSDQQAAAVRAVGAVVESGYYGASWKPTHTPDALGRLLLAENIRSVQARYPDDEPNELPGPIPTPTVAGYTYRSVPMQFIDPAQVIRAVDCWKYQTCEYTGHEDAPGWDFASVLYRIAVDRLLEPRGDLQWNWDRETARKNEQAAIDARLAQS